VPIEYALDHLAQRWNVPPWVLDSDDPEIARWVRRGMIFQQLEVDAASSRQRGVPGARPMRRR